MPGKQPIQTREQMTQEAASRKGNRLYREQSLELNDGIISNVVSKTALEMDAARHVSMADISTIKAVVRDYLAACVDASAIPTVSGLCRGLGISRRCFYDVLSSGEPRETAELFESVHDSFSDILTQVSLKGGTQPVVSIFLQKALYGFTEKVELIAKQPENPLGPNPDLSALQRKIEGIVVDDEPEESG